MMSRFRTFYFIFVSLVFTLCAWAEYPSDKQIPVPDLTDLLDSVLAPYLTFNGSTLYASRLQDGVVVCSRAETTASRLLLPITLKELDKLHNTLHMTHDGTPTALPLNPTEGCFLNQTDEGILCAASLQSDPSDCAMRIPDATNYWRYRNTGSSAAAPARFGDAVAAGADLLVRDIVRVRAMRDSLHHSLRRSKEAAKAGRDLWQIVSRGWENNTILQDQEEFYAAVTAQGVRIVMDAYDDVMKKYDILKEWLDPSLGVFAGEENTYHAPNGTLLAPLSYCNPSKNLDMWLSMSDQVYYSYVLFASSEQELEALFSGVKEINKVSITIDRVHHLPCVAVSLAVVMMLLEDFPIRSAYSDLMNSTKFGGSLNANWPHSRFAILGDRNASVSNGIKHLLETYDQTVQILQKKQYVEGLFNGDDTMALCVGQALMRQYFNPFGRTPNSIYECFLSPPFTQQNDTTASTPVLKGATGDATVEPCPWGFFRPSGNDWNVAENCILCPTGSFGDGAGGCSCGKNSYPADDGSGCHAKETRRSPQMISMWGPDKDMVYIARQRAVTDLSTFVALLQEDSNDYQKGDTMVAWVNCSLGLTQFEVIMQLPDFLLPGTSPGPTADAARLVSVPLRRAIKFNATTSLTVNIVASAAVGGEVCRVNLRVSNPRYKDLPTLSVASIVVMPPASTPQLVFRPLSRADPLAHPSPAPLCEVASTSEGVNITVSLCRNKAGRLSVLVDARAYSPLSLASYAILRQALWDNGSRAESLGTMLRPMLQRLHFSLSVSYADAYGRVGSFLGRISPKESLVVLVDLPGTVTNATVAIHALDRCSVETDDDAECGGTGAAFAQSENASMNLDVARWVAAWPGTTFPGTLANNTEVAETPFKKWVIGLAAIGILDGIAFTVVVVLAILRRKKQMECMKGETEVRENEASEELSPPERRDTGCVNVSFDEPEMETRRPDDSNENSFSCVMSECVPFSTQPPSPSEGTCPPSCKP